MKMQASLLYDGQDGRPLGRSGPGRTKRRRSHGTHDRQWGMSQLFARRRWKLDGYQVHLAEMKGLESSKKWDLAFGM